MKNDATGDPIIAPTFIKVGTFNSGTNKGSDLYKIIAGCTMGDANCIAALATFDPTQKKFKVFGSYSATMPRDPKNILTDETMTASNSNLALVNALNVPLEKLSYISTETIPDFAVPSAVALAGGYGLTQQSVPSGALGNVQPTAVGSAIDGTNVYVDMNQYFLRLPSNEYILYKITIPFFADERIPQINWNDPSIKPTDYTPTYASGCGGGKAFNIATPGDVTLPSDRFVVAGKTITGETVYVPKDSNDTLIANAYQASSYNNGDKKITQQEFAALVPIFITQDPFGQALIWTRSDAQPMAECGKPVVYLYPTQTEAVSVKLGSNITVKKSEPAYGNGWNVTAEPNGTLTTADGKTYPNLYWDGNGASYNTPTTGFVVASKDVEATFKSKLAQLGLNAKEISDFNDFWLPIVTKSPYALISFVPQAEWSKAAPLSISPAPQTLIRVFMDWKPLAEPINVAPQTLPPTPARAGFTAVEWGGLLYR